MKLDQESAEGKMNSIYIYTTSHVGIVNMLYMLPANISISKKTKIDLDSVTVSNLKGLGSCGERWTVGERVS